MLHSSWTEEVAVRTIKSTLKEGEEVKVIRVDVGASRPRRNGVDPCRALNVGSRGNWRMNHASTGYLDRENATNPKLGLEPLLIH